MLDIFWTNSYHGELLFQDLWTSGDFKYLQYFQHALMFDRHAKYKWQFTFVAFKSKVIRNYLGKSFDRLRLIAYIYVLAKCKFNQLKSILLSIFLTFVRLYLHHFYTTMHLKISFAFSYYPPQIRPSLLLREAPSIAGTFKRPLANSVCQMMRTLNNTGE